MHFNGTCPCVGGINQDPYYKWLSCPDPELKPKLLEDADAYVKFLSELEPGKRNTLSQPREPNSAFKARVVDCATGEEVGCKISHSNAPPLVINIKATTTRIF